MASSHRPSHRQSQSQSQSSKSKASPTFQPDIPQRDASIGQSPPISPVAPNYPTSSAPSSWSRHSRSISATAAPGASSGATAVARGIKNFVASIDSSNRSDKGDFSASSSSSLRAQKGRVVSDPTPISIPTSAQSASAKQSAVSIEPRKSSLSAQKPTFTRADDRGPLQKLELELKRIGKEEGLIGEGSSAGGAEISRTLSRKQAQRILRSTEVTSKATAITQPDPEYGADHSSITPSVSESRRGRSTYSSPSSEAKGKKRFSAPFAERALTEQQQGTVRQPREPAGFSVMETLPPPRAGNHSPVSNRSANGTTPAHSSHGGEPHKIDSKNVDRRKGRFHLHHRQRPDGNTGHVREHMYLDVGQEPEWETHLARLTLADLELVNEEGDIAPVSASGGYNDPPIRVKCGPLLRYTGLRKDAGREVWRGSILIVTTDSESTYDPPPTLSLFGQSSEIPSLESEKNDITTIPAIDETGKPRELRPASEVPEGVDPSHEERFGDLAKPSTAAAAGPAEKADAGPPQYDRSGSGRFRKDGERQGKARQLTGTAIATEKGLTFWRFSIEIELGETEQRIGYRINGSGAIGFYVPAADQTMNIMFHSCNGFSLAVKPDDFSGPDPMWRDVLRKHAKQPFHVMLGGGDQVYNDCVQTQSPKFKEWLAIKDQHVKNHTPFDEAFEDEIDRFYLERYCMWFSQGLYGIANSQIPQTNCFDDHDIIDGFGSYPDHFNGCAVFAGLGTVAFKYYLLFQHHTTLAEGEINEPSWLLGAHPGPFIKEPSRSTFMFLGRRVAFMALDCRTERSRDVLLSNDTYTRVFQRLEQEIVKGETKHLIILLGVPIAYPRLVWLENILTSSLMDPIKYIASKRHDGTLNGFLNKFDGGVELLDDMMDHWTARGHKRERNWLILELQKLAAARDCRVTFLGGDVHLGSFGQFISRARLNVPKINDFRYMINVVSSAIVNSPPPTALADLLNRRNKIHKLQRDTHESQIKIFWTDPKGKKRNNNTTLPARNFCRISENSTGKHCGEYSEITKPEGCDEDKTDLIGGLDLVINFEIDQHDANGFTKAYGLTTPTLQKAAA